MPDLQLYVEAERTRTDAVTDWVARGCLAAFFLMVGAEKLSTNPEGSWVALFAAIGFGQWFRYATGALQVGGALLLLVPRTALIGGLALAATMLGAVVFHLVVLEGLGGAIIPGAFLAGLVFVLVRRRRR